MLRTFAFALVIAAGPVAAGEQMDCYNDEIDAGSRYTRVTPEVLRVTDADIERMLADIRAHERRASMLARSDTESGAAD